MRDTFAGIICSLQRVDIGQATMVDAVFHEQAPRTACSRLKRAFLSSERGGFVSPLSEDLYQ